MYTALFFMWPYIFRNGLFYTVTVDLKKSVGFMSNQILPSLKLLFMNLYGYNEK